MEGMLPLVIAVVVAVGFSLLKSKPQVVESEHSFPDFGEDVFGEKPADDPYGFDTEVNVSGGFSEAALMTKIESGIDESQYNTEEQYVDGYNFDYELSQLDETPTLVTKPAASLVGLQTPKATILGEDFDLGRAVVYSEVLKPKFLDY